LQFYIRSGLKVTKIHKGFSFKQDYIFRDYIQINIDKRKQTTSELSKNLFKLLNNSLYGKTLQNSKNYGNVKFSFSRLDAIRMFRKTYT